MRAKLTLSPIAVLFQTNEDLSWLYQHIRGDVLVLGRRSFEETGKPLPGVLRTIVVSRKAEAFTDRAAGVEGAPTFRAAIHRAREISRLSEMHEERVRAIGADASGQESNRGLLDGSTERRRRMIWVGGGERIYSSALPLASHLALTTVCVHAYRILHVALSCPSFSPS
jgi:dihydrofolate reductase